MNKTLRIATISIALSFSLSLTSLSQQKRQYLESGPGQRPFDVTRRSVSIEEIKSGPPKDGIPAIDHPKFVPAKQAQKFLTNKDWVLGVEIDGAAKAYPIKILNWHEIVNDEIGGKAITVTW